MTNASLFKSNYASVNTVFEADQVELDMTDANWITIRLKQGCRTPMTLHIAARDGRKFEFFKGDLEYGDTYVLMEEIDATTDTTEPTETSEEECA
tara:strand:+ start:131 stop:415 length:285 start_codon:yes stop_codon:yes gene_type:complete